MNEAFERSWRCGLYRLLARLLSGPPDATDLDRLQQLAGPVEASFEPPIAAAWNELTQAARTADLNALDEEFQVLFIGLARGALIPFASWYRTGFLMEKPLARLRDDLAAAGIERRPSTREPEDHVAALCEAMSLLVEAGDVRQLHFFSAHMEPWMARFFDDLVHAEAARFYRSVGALGAAFMQIEATRCQCSAVISAATGRDADDRCDRSC